MRLDWLGVDANWQEHATLVYRMAKSKPKLHACNGRFVGAASLPMDLWKRDRACRSGHFWRSFRGGERPRVEIDINYWKSFICKRCKVGIGERDVWPAGSVTWFGDRPEIHELWADQVSAEYAVRVTGRGRRVDEWKNRPGRDNHYFDCLVGSAVGNSHLGAVLTGQQVVKVREKKSLRALPERTRKHA